MNGVKVLPWECQKGTCFNGMTLVMSSTKSTFHKRPTHTGGGVPIIGIREPGNEGLCIDAQPL